MNMQIEQMSEEEREEIIRYGIKRGKVIFLSTLITIMLGWLLGIVWQSIIFWFCLSILRKFAGGYHADDEKMCYLISFMVLLVSLLCIKFINHSGGWEIVLQTIVLLVILFLAPVENKNHLLDKDEKKEYGDRTKKVALMLYFIYIFLLFINRMNIAISIGVANITVAVSLLVGYMKNTDC